jgi:predicted dehydrogenase
MVKVGVVGYGYWGPNLVRNFSESDGVQVSHVADLDASRLAVVRTRYPAAATTADVGEVLRSADVDAVAIATPVATHFDLAMEALKAGKHVLIEKPMAETSEKCLQLIDEAARRKKVLMVDHTFPYTGAVRKIRELIQAGELGDIYYYDSVRINLGLFQHDVSVIWDLAVHDLSIIDFLLPQKPVAVSATGISHVKGQPENVAYLTLYFNSSTIAHIHVNWLAPVKLRTTLIGGSKRMIVYDDLEASEKVKVYDKGVSIETHPDNIYQMKVGYRTGDMWAPKIDVSEALRTLVAHFIDCIETGEAPITSGESGCRVVRLMEAATDSIARRGEQVRLD